RVALKAFLLGSYADLVKAVTRRLGSRERAEDALHDVYLRLERNGEINVQRPRAYLVRMALNIATDTWRSENPAVRGGAMAPQGGTAMLSAQDGDAVLDAIDENPDAEQIAIDRSELRRLEAILAELPQRRRAIFEAVWIVGETPEGVSRRFGLALRTIQ